MKIPMNQRPAKMGRSTLLFSIAVVLAAQLSINLFINNFKISIGIVLFPLFLFLIDDFPLISVTLTSGIFVFLSRVLLYWLQYGYWQGAAVVYFPEAIFYIFYGLLLYIYFKRIKFKMDRVRFFLPLFIMDYAANLVELFFRLRYDSFSFKTQLSIVLVAFVRTLIIWVLITAFDYYGFSLIKKEHAQRYKKLLILISKLKGEMIWMKKNTTLIEQTMNTSYQLFNQMKEHQLDESLSSPALSVAKDIHEIKKEYVLIMRGISEALEDDLKDEGMYLHELLQILQDSLVIAFAPLGKQFHFDLQCSKDIYTTKHYLLMSVFNNLFTNAAEATECNPVTIAFSQADNGDSYTFTVKDLGSGIQSNHSDDIFLPGFSTKINYETGEINRGLGLCLVKDIITNEFSGSITVASAPTGTTFYVHIPKHTLED